MTSEMKRIEFRIPISPTPHFFSLVRFFNFALRRLEGAHYKSARLTIVVGDHCDIDAVRRENRWSEAFDIVWERVPDEIFAEFHWAGTANWRLALPAERADIIVLSDADTVLLRDIDPLIAEWPSARPALRGHMAHFPPRMPPTSAAPKAASAEFWPWLFGEFGIDWPDEVFPYSIDADRALPRAPAYFNLGFVALDAAARDILGRVIAETTRQLSALIGESFMRCQIALTIAAYRSGAIDIATLPPEYNAANDAAHLDVHKLSAAHIRVLHFLRSNEIDRAEFQLDRLDAMLARPVTNPANLALQRLAQEYRDSLG